MKQIIVLVLLTFLVACSNQGKQVTEYDAIPNTKKLFKKGHSDLYENGAFSIPNTSISLIPAGPSAMEFAAELFKLDARQSLLDSIKKASESVQVVSIGTQKTYQFSKSIFNGGQELAHTITEHSRPGGMLLINRSAKDAQNIIGQSWQLSKDSANFLIDFSDSITDGGIDTANSISKSGAKSSKAILAGSFSAAKNVSGTMLELSGEAFKFAGQEFIKGYVALPKNLSERAENMSAVPAWHHYAKGAKKTNEWREETSNKMTFFVKDAAENYFENIGNSFDKSGDALNKKNETGTLAVLKFLGWALHGVFWEGMIKPAAKITAGSIGFIAVNTVVYPVMLVGHSSASLAEVAVKVTWNTGAMAYDFVAPTAKAAIASILGTAEAATGVLAGGAVMTMGTVASGSTLIGTQAAAVTVATTGIITGEAVKYIGVPLAASGIAVGGAAVGVTVGVGEAALGAGTLIAGETASIATQAVSTGTSAVTMTTGTVASGAVAVGYGMYQLGKAVVVPTGYTLSSGIVLSYGSVSQIAAHSVLLASDAAYLVLSMEGSDWVIYTVKDVFNMGDKLAGGTVLDLETMQNNGEQFKRLPISKEDMDAVIEHIPQDLKTI